MDLENAKMQIDASKAQLVGENYSRMIITINYETESEGINNFYTQLHNKLDNELVGNYHIIGDSAMSYEMSKTFRSEFLFISIITAVAIFIVIAISFRKIIVPAILVIIIQCGVYIAMTVMYVNNVSMYYIALLIVQCILMGSIVDYGILFTSYYQKIRKSYSIKDALCTRNQSIPS